MEGADRASTRSGAGDLFSASVVRLGGAVAKARIAARLWPDATPEARAAFEDVAARFNVRRGLDGLPVEAEPSGPEDDGTLVSDPVSGVRTADIDAFSRREYGLGREDLQTMFRLGEARLPARRLANAAAPTAGTSGAVGSTVAHAVDRREGADGSGLH